MRKVIYFLLFLLFSILIISCSDDENLLDQYEQDYLRVEFSECIACLECIEKFECPYGAISYDEKHNTAVIDPEKCVKCELCITDFRCPELAITKYADIWAPAKIPFFAQTDTAAYSAEIMFKKSGDSDTLGVVFEYELRFSDSALDTNDAALMEVILDTTVMDFVDTITYTISGLEPDNDYYAAVTAFDEAGNSSPPNFLKIITKENDVDPPSRISDLAAENIQLNTALLSWTAPGDDGNLGNAEKYVIRYSSNNITAENWNSCFEYTNTLIPLPSGNNEELVLEDLYPNTEYYFGVKSMDNAGNYSEISNIVNFQTLDYPDTIAPGKIENLQLIQISANPPVVRLVWTAPGDDAYDGNADSYIIKKLSEEITEENWAAAENIENTVNPQSAGEQENFDIEIDFDTETFFAVKTVDENSNISEISNSPSIIINEIDTTPPGEVTDLNSVVFSEEPPKIELFWTASGDDSYEGTASQYVIKKSYQGINEGNWNLAVLVENNMIPHVSGSSESIVIDGEYDVNVFYALKVVDDNQNLSDVSNTVSAFIEGDHTPPSAVSDLSLENVSEDNNGEIKLIWTAPGDDENSGTASKYMIRYNNIEITESNWSESNEIENDIEPLASGEEENFYFSCSFGETYYFALKSEDENGNISEISNSPYLVLESDNIPPGDVTDLHIVEQQMSSNSIMISWTAPGDDGDSGGQITGYDLRYSTSVITDANWNNAQSINVSSIANPGSSQTASLTNAVPGEKYYFAVKSVDDNDNWSNISNSASGRLYYQIVSPPCNSCGRCVNRCPNDAISYSGGHMIIDLDECDQCGTCLDYCPRSAIKLFAENY